MVVTGEVFTGIANSIRSKTGKTAKMKITEMSAEIDSIVTETLVTLTVTLNPAVSGVNVTATAGGKGYNANTNASGVVTLSVRPGYDYTVTANNYSTNVVHVDASGGSTTLVNATIVVKVTDPNKNTSIAFTVKRGSEVHNGVVNASSGVGTASVTVYAVGSYTVSITAPTGGVANEVSVTTVAGSSVTASITISYELTFTMNYNASNFVSSPDNCLTYAGGCAGFTPVSGPGSSGSTPAKCKNIGSWVMNADGTSSNPLLNKCFYATFTDAGVLHEKLNPQDLTKKIATWNNSTKKWVSATGSSSITSENTMFCIPTIYVSSTSTSITLSEKEKVGSKPFAHTIDNHVYQYMAIGVYPANEAAPERMKSISGATSTVNMSQSIFVAACRDNRVQNGKAMLCNWFQRQLYRLLVLFSIRHFNSQLKIGNGGQKYGEKTTGLMNAMGPFAGSSSTSTGDSQGVKAYIENPWGHNVEFLGDFKYVSDGVYAFQTSTQNPTSTTGGINVKASPHSLTSPGLASGSISTEPETWGWGTGSGGSATTGGCDFQDLPFSGRPFCIVGGSGNVSDGNAGVSSLGPDDGAAYRTRGGRLVFVFDIDGGGEPVNPSEPYDLSNVSYTERSSYDDGLFISISGIVVNDTSNVSKIVVVCEVRDIVATPTLSKELQKDDPNGEYTLMSGRIDPTPNDSYITSATIKVFDTSGVVIQEKQI